MDKVNTWRSKKAVMTQKTRSIFNKLLYSGIILLLILLLQPLEVALFLKKISVIFPKGFIAIKERDLLLLIQGVMLIFIIPIYIITFVFSWRYRAENKEAKYDPHLVDHKVAEIIWWGLPLIFTIIIAIVTVIKTYELDPYRPIKSDKKAIEIQVVALQWKWLFIYPEENIATVNYIKIPTETPIHFSITSDAPMNSFWIPSLGGQIYAMPGMKTELNLIADKEGSFRGSSANISGKGFSGMTFITEAASEESYQKWLESVKASSQFIDAAVYEKLAAPSENNPVELFQLKEEGLFHNIIMNYMQPSTKA